MRAQAGATLGGVRTTFFVLGQNPFRMIGELAVANGGAPMAVGMGTREFFSLYLLYGLDAGGNVAGLGYFPAGCDRLRVTFDSNSRLLNFTVLAYQTGTPAPSQAGINLSPSPSGSPLCVDFPFDTFVSGGGAPQEFATKGIGILNLIFNSGSEIGASDFAVTRFETVDAATAAANPCAFAVTNPSRSSGPETLAPFPWRRARDDGGSALLSIGIYRACPTAERRVFSRSPDYDHPSPGSHARQLTCGSRSGRFFRPAASSGSLLSSVGCGVAPPGSSWQIP